MKVSRKSVELLQQHLKNLNESSETKEIEELLNAVTEISKLESTDDILELSAHKLKELDEYTNKLIKDVEKRGNDKLFEFANEKDNVISSIEHEKESQITAIANLSESKQKNLNSIVDDFDMMNDIPSNSSIISEIAPHLDAYNFFKVDDLPFLFGILSRYDDYYGIGGFTSELGQWYNSGADTMLSILAGCHEYTTEYTGFYIEPKLCFFQGFHGNFNKKKSYITYQRTSSQYTYPYAALGCLFVKNVTDEEIVSTINFGGANYWNSGYEGASMFLGVPDHGEELINWTNIFFRSSSGSSFSATADITIPAKTTVCILLYTSSYYITSPSSKSYHAQFIHWYMNSIRSGFLVNGLKIDFDTTMKAWQCAGNTTTYGIFR